jgi:superfamily II DNA/RNA helicase
MSTSTPTTGASTFADFGLEQDLCDALADAGIVNPFPIQELTLGLAIAGADIIGQARTGTGKTLAFGLPMLQRVDVDAARGSGPSAVQALVIVPTRELCVQVAEDLTAAGSEKGVDVVAVYGGKAMDPQIDALSKGAQVVVGTPGRLLDLMRRGVLDLSSVRGLVLDEADEMLDLGFLPDVEQLIQATAADRQTLLFSATMPSAVVALARRYMEKPTFMRADVEEVHIAPETTQHFFSCHRMDKPAVLARILQAPDRGLCVVFSRTKRMCDILADELRERGIAAAPIHSDLRQESREKALNRFRQGKIDVLVATEVAARGLDIDDVTHVVNYDCPDDEKMYLHRIGRTGRAGAAGVAVTLAVWSEAARLEMIKKALEIDVPTHEVFSTSPILDELFALPKREGDERGPRTITKSDVDRARGRSGGRKQREASTDAAGRSARRTPEEPREGRGKRAEAADTATDDEGGGQAITRRRRRSRSSADERTEAAVQEAAPRTDEGGGGAGSEAETRRRTRRRATAETSAQSSSGRRRSPGATPQGPTAEGARDAGDADEDAAAPRTRRRARTTQDRSTRGGEPRDGGAAGSDDPRDRGSDAARTRTRTRRQPSAPSQQVADGGDRQRSGAAGAGRRAKAPSAAETSGGSRGGRGGRGSRGGKGRQTAARSGERDGGRGQGGDGRARRQQVSSDEARGDGTPRLRRPLEVTHLP